VTGTTRSISRAKELEADGIHGAILDLDAVERSDVWKTPYDSVVYSVSPGRGGDGRLGFLDGVLRSAECLRDRPPSRFVYVSSTGVYGQRDGGSVDEMSPTAPSTENQRLILEAEHALLERSGVPAVVVRLGGLYGPGRSPLDWLRREDFRARLSGSEDAFMNWIHADDAAAAVAAAAVRGRPGEVYLAVDGNPVRRGDFWRHAASLAGVEPPGLTRDLTDLGKRCSNRKIIDELDVDFAYPNYRSGLASLA